MLRRENREMKKGIRMVVGMSLIGLLVSGCSVVGDKSDSIKEYMTAVYAPESMKEFYAAKKDSERIFSSAVTNRFFVAYSNELSEIDKMRRCESVVIHGKKENQSDNRERYLVRAYLYETPKSDAVVKYFTFIVGDSGLIEDFTIDDDYSI